MSLLVGFFWLRRGLRKIGDWPFFFFSQRRSLAHRITRSHSSSSSSSSSSYAAAARWSAGNEHFLAALHGNSVSFIRLGVLMRFSFWKIQIQIDFPIDGISRWFFIHFSFFLSLSLSLSLSKYFFSFMQLRSRQLSGDFTQPAARRRLIFRNWSCSANKKNDWLKKKKTR